MRQLQFAHGRVADEDIAVAVDDDRVIVACNVCSVDQFVYPSAFDFFCKPEVRFIGAFVDGVTDIGVPIFIEGKRGIVAYKLAVVRDFDIPGAVFFHRIFQETVDAVRVADVNTVSGIQFERGKSPDRAGFMLAAVHHLYLPSILLFGGQLEATRAVVEITDADLSLSIHTQGGIKTCKGVGIHYFESPRRPIEYGQFQPVFPMVSVADIDLPQ